MQHSSNEQIFNYAAAVRQELLRQHKLTYRNFSRLGKDWGVPVVHQQMDAAEWAAVAFYRAMLMVSHTKEVAFQRLTDFYDEHQPSFTTKSSRKQLFQQFSTPAPLAALCGWFCHLDKARSVLEPNGGTGMMLIGLPDRSKATVNEIEPFRRRLLELSEYGQVLSQDTDTLSIPNQRFDVVIGNPPFELLPERQRWNGFEIKRREHLHCLMALGHMKPTGRAALIIYGHNEFDDDGRFKDYRIFFNALYHYYHVIDVISVHNDFYKKQGAWAPVRVILIAGRKPAPEGFAQRLVAQPELAEVCTTWGELWTRFKSATERADMRFPIEFAYGRLTKDEFKVQHPDRYRASQLLHQAHQRPDPNAVPDPLAQFRPVDLSESLKTALDVLADSLDSNEMLRTVEALKPTDKLLFAQYLTQKRYPCQPDSVSLLRSWNALTGFVQPSSSLILLHKQLQTVLK
ncbi:hypothetical protein SAMN05421823_11928 [Catalinimonas alkaloidigena]|uniref:Uncharacterized protein n=1 Tax=Catalinimonas alkaloidigena TaxID=1075417 RepID=A0A1G9V6B9_9BACT|nr:hypothetical protein [Catalinimonas alkaloidigena]SDM67640.1 hypothetical protein SAMN05421823_11928 [Catalinimonas alkaloidigena]